MVLTLDAGRRCRDEHAAAVVDTHTHKGDVGLRVSCPLNQPGEMWITCNTLLGEWGLPTKHGQVMTKW